MSDQKPKFISSALTPGTHKLKINSFDLKKRSFNNRDSNPIFDVILNVEGEPLGGNFRGFKKDYNDPNSPTYLGQVGRLRLNEYGYSDSKLADGTEISADKDILRNLKSLCMEIGQLKWFQDVDDKLPTPESLIKELNASGIFKDHYLYYTVCSRQYINNKGYTADDLFLGKYKAGVGKPFSKTVEDLIPFSSTAHITKAKDLPTAGKGAGQTSVEFKDESTTNNELPLTSGPDSDLPF